MTGKETERIDALLDELLRLRRDRDQAVAKHLALRSALTQAMQSLDKPGLGPYVRPILAKALALAEAEQ